MAVTYKMLPCKGHNSPILKCIGMKKWDEKGSEFYKSNSKFAYFPAELQKRGQEPVGLIPYCKECVQKIFEHYFNESNNFQLAVYYTCQKIDIPFILELFDGIFKEYKETKSAKEYTDLTKKYMSVYITNYNKASVRYKDKTDFSFSDSDMSTIDVKIESREKAKQELDRFKLDWGNQNNDEDYAFLEYRYDVYTDGKSLTPAQESLYRQLCLVELAKRRKEDSKDSTKEEQDMMIKLMTQLKINNFNEDKEKSEIDRIIEKQIWEIENTEPCELVDKEEYKDFLDLGKNWGKHILRATKNLLVGSKDYPDITKDNWD